MSKTPQPNEFLVVPINDLDLIAFFRGSDVSRPLYLRYSTFLDILSQSIGGGTLLLLKTNGVQNPVQTILNLVDGSGMTITDEGGGNIKFTSSGGASYITSTSDSADIELDVTAGDLNAVLTAIGTAGTFGDATNVPQITVDSKGRITGVTLVAITAGAGTVTSVATAGLISGGTITTSGTITTLMSTNKLVGRGTAGSGIMEEITLGTGLSLTGNTLNATGGGGVTSVTATAPITSSGGATPDISTSMNTNKMIGRYSVGTGVMEELNVGAGLAISGSSIIATGSASGGSSINYYLNGGTAASVLTYYQMSKTAVVGTNVDFPLAGNGLITQWLTDVGDPNRIEIPAGNWNLEIFMSASSAGGTPAFYVELLKYNGVFTTIANSSAAPENITGGTSIDLYLTSLAIPYTTLLATDRLALRVYIVNSVIGRTITMHTQDSHLCQVITNFAGGIVSINGVGANTQFLITGTAGTDFNIDSTSTPDTHIFNLPTASAANRGALSTTDWSTFNGKQNLLTTTKSVKVISDNVELDGDQASPAYPGVYGIDAAGVKNWRTDVSVRGDIPSVFMQESYPVTINQTGILYVPSVSKLYVCNNTSNSISIFDTTTGATLATLANTGAFQPFYIASINEVWVTSSSLTTINRISVTLNSSIATIAGATANGVECIEYSSTKVFILVQAVPGSIMLINPSTLTVTSSITTNVPTTPIGMALNTNVASLQYDKIIISAAGGVAIFNPATNLITTTLVNPSSVISSGRTIKYITSTDQYVIANPGGFNIIFLSIASATTFTFTSVIRNFAGIQDLCVDEASGYIFTTSSGLGAGVIFVNTIDLTTKKVNLAIPTNVTCGISGAAGKISLDLPNKRMFVCGRAGQNNLVSAIKYL